MHRVPTRVALIVIGQNLGQVHVRLGHQGPMWSVVEVAKLHLDLRTAVRNSTTVAAG